MPRQVPRAKYLALTPSLPGQSSDAVVYTTPPQIDKPDLITEITGIPYPDILP